MVTIIVQMAQTRERVLFTGNSYQILCVYKNHISFSFDYVIVYLINFFFTDMCYRTKSKVSDLLTCVPMDTRFGINTSVTMWQDRVCDGVPHCLNGQDEAFCVTGIPGGYLQIVQLESKLLYSHYIVITVAYVYSTMAI